MLGRTDPFFASRTKGASGYLESLQRTYGSSSLMPGRESDSYSKALEFRKAEKQRYKTMEDENEQLHKFNKSLTTTLDELKLETQRISDAWTRISSKSEIKNEQELRADSTPDSDGATSREQQSRHVRFANGDAAVDGLAAAEISRRTCSARGREASHS